MAYMDVDLSTDLDHIPELVDPSHAAMLTSRTARGCTRSRRRSAR
jgi:hypothetical protein